MRIAFAAIVISIASLVASCAEPAPLPEGANARVTRVIDGDTIDVQFVVSGHTSNDRVRLIGIDTPETKKPGSPIECFGPEASHRTLELLPTGTPVMVHRDVEPRDDYGRLLGYVIRTSDGLFVNEELLDEGMATTLAIAPNNRLQTRFATVEAAARAARRGLWGSCIDAVAGSVTP